MLKKICWNNLLLPQHFDLIFQRYFFAFECLFVDTFDGYHGAGFETAFCEEDFGEGTGAEDIAEIIAFTDAYRTPFDYILPLKIMKIIDNGTKWEFSVLCIKIFKVWVQVF